MEEVEEEKVNMRGRIKKNRRERRRDKWEGKMRREEREGEERESEKKN